MWKTIATTCTILIGLFAGSQAFAQGFFYAGGHISLLDYEDDVASDDASLAALLARGGYDFNSYLTGEVRAGIGIGGNPVTVDGEDVDIKVKHLYGSYLRLGVPLGDMFFPHLTGGYTEMKLEARGPGGTDSDTESGASWGAGIDIHATGNVTLNIEYMHYLDTDDVDIRGLNFGAVYWF